MTQKVYRLAVMNVAADKFLNVGLEYRHWSEESDCIFYTDDIVSTYSDIGYIRVEVF
jgi:hypothetical protein